MKKKLFKNTKPEHYFRAMDGSELKSVVELAAAIPHMSADTFHSHLTPERNDFSNWVRDVFQEHELADSLNNCTSQQEAELAVLRHIVHKK